MTEYKDIDDLKILDWIEGYIVSPSAGHHLALILEIKFLAELKPYTLIYFLPEDESSHIAPSVDDLERFYVSRADNEFILHIVHPEYGGAYRINDCIIVTEAVRELVASPSFLARAYSNTL